MRNHHNIRSIYIPLGLWSTFGKPFSDTDTIHCCIQKCNLNYITQRGSHESTLRRNAAKLSENELISDRQKDRGHLLCGQMSPRSSCVWGKRYVGFQVAKITVLLSAKGAKARVFDDMGVHRCPRLG